jgi:hypothetical protein
VAFFIHFIYATALFFNIHIFRTPPLDKNDDQGFIVYLLGFITMTYVRELVFQIIEHCGLNQKINLGKKMAGYGSFHFQMETYS